MKKFSFSKEQELALSLKKENMLVSAGAGSGKTAVLVERLVRLLVTKNVALDRLLVLTFTRDGAEEFKTRIKKELSALPEHAHKAFALDNADITTIDAFSLKLVKKYGYLHNLDPNIINLDEQIESILLRRSFDEVMSTLYEEPTKAFINYAKRFLLKDDNDLFAMVLSLHKQANLSLDHDKFIKNFINTFYAPSRFAAIYAQFNELIVTKLRRIASLVKTLQDERHVDAFTPFLESYGDVLTVDDFLQKEELVKTVWTPRNSYTLFPEDQKPATEAKSIMAELRSFVALGDQQQMLQIFNENKAHATFVHNIYTQTMAKVNAYKQEKNAFTFSDIARRAFSLVQEDSVRQELKAQYDYILIDEYQDTSDIQEALIQEIATDNVYMVGDIKQSIYMFRNANSDIFQAKYARFAKKDGGVLVDLNDNYRSRLEVLTSINAILSEIMSEDIGGANYRKEHIIGYGNKVYDQHFVAKQHSGLKVLTYDMPPKDAISEHEQRLSQAEIEADLIIADINNKVNSGFLVLGKNDTGEPIMRPVDYGDFTILISRTTHFDKIERRFIAAGIPFFQNKDEVLADDKVIIAFNALLKIFVAYTAEDMPTSYAFRFAVASFLRSFVNNYSDQALLDLMGAGNRDYSNDPLLHKIKCIAKAMKDEPVNTIVMKLVDTFALYSALNRIGNVLENTYKLMNHIAKVNDLAALDFSLAEIIDYFDAIKKEKLDSKIKRPKLQDNSVTIMTIHKSKGLEFPIVYYMDTEQDFYRRENTDIQLAVDKTYGFTMYSPGRIPTINMILSKEHKQQAILSERIRLLYVALTRAREKMIILHRNDEKLDMTKDVKSVKNFKELLAITKPYQQAMTQREVTSLLPNKQHEIPSFPNDECFIVAAHKQTFTKTEGPLKLETPISVSDTILARGTLLHKYIELYDFKVRKLDYIPNRFDRAHIKKLLALPIFKNANEENVYREYDFIDEKTEKTYVIDMFILGAREITLFDFKLVNIDNEVYDKQLANYAKHLANVFRRPVVSYLVSIINLNYRKLQTSNE